MSMPLANDCILQSSVTDESRSALDVHRIQSCETKIIRKRKHDQIDDSSRNWRPFGIQAASPGAIGESQPLTPKFLLPRSCLPLAYLDLSGGGETTSSSRLFAAQIGLLNVSESQQARPTVLIAQSKSGPYYAIERVREGIYALCKLAQCVEETALENIREPCSSSEVSQKRVAHNDLALDSNEWWHCAALPSPFTPPALAVSKSAIKRVQAFKLSLKRHSQKDRSPGPAERRPSTPIPQEPDIPKVDEVVENEMQKPEEIFKHIRTQYQEALYLSKASLAYFAKGPLSRARARFQDKDDPTSECSELIQHLRTMILTLPVMDRKYRETLPNMVQEFPFSMLSGGETRSVIEAVKKKSRKSKKDKVGKDGLFAGEDIEIAKWWLGRDLSGVPCDTEEARKGNVKTTLLEQRAREAQLQIILVLETLSLETSAKSSGTKPTALEKLGHNEQDEAPTKPKRAQKPQDLHTLLDLLADRLGIWQSMSSDAENPSSNGQRPPSASQRKSPTDSLVDDHLRQFCVDVVLPFYGARLPELSTLLCQKLGGPKDPSPKRVSSLNLEALSKVSAKPGAPVQRQQPRKPRRTLERVLTDDRSRHRRQTPSLSRSATEPVLPQVKREVSDTSLSSIPLNRVVMSKRYTQREVDLRAASQATEARHRKNVAVQQELQGAIAAIKKPNPKMAGREFVETVEKRQASSHSRKPKHPVRNPFAQGLQVMVTPSKNRKAEAYNLPPLPQVRATTTAYELNRAPPPSFSHIPSSTTKLRGPTSSGDRDVGRTIERPSCPVDQTPTKGSAKFSAHPPDLTSTTSTGHRQPSQAFLAPCHMGATSEAPYNLPTWHSNLHDTPSKRDQGVLHTSPMPGPNIAGTPCKQRSTNPSKLDTPSRSSQQEEPDLYASLGWNYDVDD